MLILKVIQKTVHEGKPRREDGFYGPRKTILLNGSKEDKRHRQLSNTLWYSHHRCYPKNKSINEHVHGRSFNKNDKILFKNLGGLFIDKIQNLPYNWVSSELLNHKTSLKTLFKLSQISKWLKLGKFSFPSSQFEVREENEVLPL